MSIYDLQATTISKDNFDFSTQKGKVLLIVNVASKCGLTPQYQELEALYQKYKDQGLLVIGFPCNQFGGQEPGDAEAISEFCEINYGVSFLMMSKVEVNGKNADPVFQYLKGHSNSGLIKMIKWNFTKFLVSRDGSTIKRYGPTTKPLSFETDIEKLLSEK